MKLTLPLRTLAAFVCAGALVAAQGETKKPAQDGHAKPAVKEASVSTEPGLVLHFDVTGLSKDNEAKVKESLGALTTAHYVCDACKVDQAAAGNCPKCSGALAMKQKPVIQSSVAQADQGSMSVTVAPGSIVAYSQLESALGKNSVHIDPAKFPIAGKAKLVVTGATSESAATIQKALQDAKLFDEVKANFDAAKNELHVIVRAGAMAPTRAKVESALGTTGAKLGDIVFGAGAPAKA